MTKKERKYFSLERKEYLRYLGVLLDEHLTWKHHPPVQKNYTAVPRPLFPEVKSYVEDLLDKNFIRKSTSPYSSPVICVRKKDQTLRLCIDYRELNKKRIPDRHPIPRIQETLDSLEGGGGTRGSLYWTRGKHTTKVT